MKDNQNHFANKILCSKSLQYSVDLVHRFSSEKDYLMSTIDPENKLVVARGEAGGGTGETGEGD